MDVQKIKFIMLLKVVLVTFALLFFLGLWALENSYSIFNLGLPNFIENWIIVVLSLAGVVMASVELLRV